MRGWTLGRGWRGGERGERWTTALESDGGGGEDGEARAGCQVDRTRCYRRRRNRLTSQRCHLCDVSSYLFRLSLSIRNGRRVTEEEAMRAVRELDREQLDLVSGERRRGRKEVDRMKRSMSSWSTLFTQAKVTSWYQLFFYPGHRCLNSGLLQVEPEVQCWKITLVSTPGKFTPFED